jgi:stage V sporulation protein G
MNMRITAVKIYPTNEDLVKADVTITFDNCFMISEIKIIQSRAGLFVSMPSRKQSDGTDWDIAYPANVETRNLIEQAILAEYQKIVTDPVPSENQEDKTG